MSSSATNPVGDQVVIVTGASSGIGREAALEFARRGFTVVGVARREGLLESLTAACREHSPASFHLCGDLGDRDFACRIVPLVEERLGRVDVLINNAAISKHKHIFHTSTDEAEAVMRINFLSCVWTTLSAIPVFLRGGGGTIVNVSSFAALVAPPREALYAASKAAMNAFSQGMWLDLEGSGIHVALVNPGPIDTEIWEKEDEPPGYHGHKYPPKIVVDAIFESIEKRIHEVTVPRFDTQLISARALSLFAPGLLRMGMHRMEPVPSELIDAARRRASSHRAGGNDLDAARGNRETQGT